MYSLTLHNIQSIFEEAVQQCIQNAHFLSVAIVDAGGHLICFFRHPQAVIASIETSQVKAKTSIYFSTDTRNLPSANPIAVPIMAGVSFPVGLFPGGVLIRSRGAVCGAVGVGGGSAEQDQSFAELIQSFIEKKLSLEV